MNPTLPRLAFSILVLCCFSSRLPAAEIKLGPLKDIGKAWLKDAKGADVSGQLDAVIWELFTKGKKTAAIRRFENAILQGRPLDADRNAFHIALNLLVASKMECRLIVPIIEREPARWEFAQREGRIVSRGTQTTALDFSKTPTFKVLGKVDTDFEIVATLDKIHDSKDKPSTARLTLSAVLTVSRRGSKKTYRRPLGQYKLTAGEKTPLSQLRKWD